MWVVFITLLGLAQPQTQRLDRYGQRLFSQVAKPEAPPGGTGLQLTVQQRAAALSTPDSHPLHTLPG